MVGESVFYREVRLLTVGYFVETTVQLNIMIYSVINGRVENYARDQLFFTAEGRPPAF